MNYFELYPGDYLRDTTRLTLLEHGAYLRLLMAYYAEEEPLPADHGELFVIVGAASAADKSAVRKVADRYFPVGPDGDRRNGRADAEIAKAAKRMQGAQERKSEKNGNETERQRRTRARRTKLFMDLRDVGIVPGAMTSMADLKALHAEHVTRDMGVTNAVLSRVTERDIGVTDDVTGRDMSREVTGVNTGNQTPHAIQKSISPARTQGDDPPAASPTDAGRACWLMRQAGCISTNPSYQPLLDALAAGVTPEALGHTAAEAIATRKTDPFKWACATALGRHLDGHATATGANHATSSTSSSSSASERAQQSEQAHAEWLAASRHDDSDDDGTIEGTARRVG